MLLWSSTSHQHSADGSRPYGQAIHAGRRALLRAEVRETLLRGVAGVAVARRRWKRPAVLNLELGCWSGGFGLICERKSTPGPGLQTRISRQGFRSLRAISPPHPAPETSQMPRPGYWLQRGQPLQVPQRMLCRLWDFSACVAVRWIFTLVIRSTLLGHGPFSAGGFQSEV